LSHIGGRNNEENRGSVHGAGMAAMAGADSPLIDDRTATSLSFPPGLIIDLNQAPTVVICFEYAVVRKF